MKTPQTPRTAQTRTKRTIIGVTTGVVAVGAALGVANLASAAPTPTPGATPTAGATPSAGSTAAPQPGAGRHGDHARDGFGRGGAIASELATKLGLDQAKVETALREVREANKPTAKPTPGATPTPRDPAADDAALAKALAPKLGVTEAKINTALDEIRAAHVADRAAALKTKLDAAIKAGTLTQAEADAVTKAVDKGVINVGGR